MRFGNLAGFIGFWAAFSVLPFAEVSAQNTQTQYIPLYNATPSSQTYYAPTNNGSVPVYNNAANTPSLPLEQMVAGKNAPSYNYNQTTQPYTFGAGTSGPNAFTAEQEAQVQAQYQAQLQAQQQYINSLYQQNPAGGQPGAAAVANGLTGGIFGTTPSDQAAAPKQRRLVYRERNNPLSAPPLLFNPDQ